MDKLKPILAQKFWILFGLVLILPMVGYFMTKGVLATDIETRWKKLTDTFSGIPPGTGVPNESWSKALNDTTAKQKVHNIRANQELWAKQHERMSWPNDIAPIMAKAKYFEDLTEEQKGLQVIFKYPLSYRAQIRNLWEIVDPLEDGTNLRDSDKRRKVAFSMSDIQQSAAILAKDIQPTFKDIWEAQENIWLQTELLQAVRRINENANNQGDAPIKQLGKIQLFGGARSTGDSGAAASSGTSGDGMGMGMGMGMGFGGNRNETTTVSADINLNEEFVVSFDPAVGGGNNGGMGGFGAAAGFTEPSSGGSGSGAAASGAGTKPDVKRYIDLDEQQPYKRRGFYIKLTMDHTKVPDLIAELMNSPFPVEIVRVQQVWNSDQSTSPAGGAGAMMAGGGTGFSGFKPPMATSSGGSDAGSSGAAVGFTEASDDGSGSGGSGASGGTGRVAPNNPGSAAALADPKLAQVAIVGVWTLYLPPPPAADQGQVPPTESGTPPPAVAVTPEAPATPAEAPTVAAESDPKPADGNGDEPKKPADPDAPKSEPDNSEKPAPQKPASDQPAEKTEPTEKSESQ